MKQSRFSTFRGGAPEPERYTFPSWCSVGDIRRRCAGLMGWRRLKGVSSERPYFKGVPRRWGGLFRLRARSGAL